MLFKIIFLIRTSKYYLDNGNVVPILVSASFLQMEPLFQECLLFCKNNINDVLSSSASFGCVNDGVITRFVSKFLMRYINYNLVLKRENVFIPFI